MDFSMSRRKFLVRGAQMAATAGVAGSMLAACGSSGGSTSSTSGEKVTLTYGWWSDDPTHDNAMRAWIKDFETSHPNITINPEILPWSSYWTKVQTTTAGGNAYDIIGMAGGMAAPYFNQGALYDLSQFSDFQSAASSLNENVLSLTTWNSKPYALPVGVYVPTLGYNKDLFKAAGIPLLDPSTPITFEEFKAIAHKLTKKQGNTYVQYALNPAYFLEIDNFVIMEGGSVYDRVVNPTKVTINTPQGIQGLTDYLSLYTENLVVPLTEQTSGAWGTGDISSLQTGKVAFARTGAYDFQIIQNSSPNIGVAPIFSLNGKHTVLGGANSLSIYAGSKHPNEAWEFLKWATSTQPERQFATFSDLPANKTALAQLSGVITPAAFIPTVLSDYNAFSPSAVTTSQQLATDFSEITTDMINGKLTPAQAAAKMEQKGNADLASAQ